VDDALQVSREEVRHFVGIVPLIPCDPPGRSAKKQGERVQQARGRRVGDLSFLRDGHQQRFAQAVHEPGLPEGVRPSALGHETQDTRVSG